ncbi:hypothetical protein C1T17_08000 [Sphingobium sp. SCG-1]|uniref:3TM-type holin n=1 Tax=Sphingobium sp. SCG-1 TaxID=2072936 RepID=UPI000CD69658|nr:3TM-type holin [Sphingobium sp. SCG-1]AUW58058.1 hypothetical protein C1T17_08000 [Sphingobium sp. SCG-1]
MAICQSDLMPLLDIVDRVVTNRQAANRVKLELLTLAASRQGEDAAADTSALMAEVSARDLWTSRARPTFLYVIYALLLWSIPMGLIAGVRPDVADAIARGMTGYLHGLPEPLYALFGTGYLGYTAARMWGKVKGVDR